MFESQLNDGVEAVARGDHQQVRSSRPCCGRLSHSRPHSRSHSRPQPRRPLTLGRAGGQVLLELPADAAGGRGLRVQPDMLLRWAHRHRLSLVLSPPFFAATVGT